ncbi:c-type cytochrome [Burkholderia ambifaria]|uniref:c-type cytochrome n=1 Tax=Burkholderia ambifaria TaxID=152480 RepID=UPI00159153E3|nr:cytochrome c [Burkholderia ambifaria]
MKIPKSHDTAHQREFAEPDERANPVPWMLGLIAVSLLVWGVSYFLLDPQLMPGGQQRAGSASAQPGAAPATIDGGQLYTSNCASCHQSSGAGMPGVFPPLAGSEWVTGDPAKLAQILLRGVAGPLTVNGTSFNAAMPEFGPRMSDAEIAAVATHIRGSFGNKAQPVSADLIKQEREKSQGKTAPVAGDKELRASP